MKIFQIMKILKCSNFIVLIKLLINKSNYFAVIISKIGKDSMNKRKSPKCCWNKFVAPAGEIIDRMLYAPSHITFSSCTDIDLSKIVTKFNNLLMSQNCYVSPARMYLPSLIL